MCGSAIHFQRFNSNTTTFPLSPFHQIPPVCYPAFALIAAQINLPLHGKDVSHLVFFLTYPRPDSGSYPQHSYQPQLTFVGPDELGNISGLPGRLGDLPLHPDKDGWHSVLGAWNGTTEDPEAANGAAQVNPENNTPIPIPVTPPRNARPPLPRIFCHYPMCSGNKLAVPSYPELYLVLN